MPTVESIRSFWNEKAKENAYWYVSSAVSYDKPRDLDEFWQSGGRIWTQLKEIIGYRPGRSDCVAEIGCGVGRLSRAIACDVRHVDAFDISDEMLDIAQQARLRNVTFHRAQGFGLGQLADCSAEVVLAYCVFQHLPSIDALSAYLNEMVRVAKPGGIIAFSLVPRTETDRLMPFLRARAFLREKALRRGPRGIHRREWIGIKPRVEEVHRIAPIPLKRVDLFGDLWLFFGTKR